MRFPRRRRPRTQRPTLRSWLTWTPSTSACPRHCERRRTPTCPTSSRRWNRLRATCIPASSSVSNRRPTQGRPRKSCSRCSKLPGSRRAAIFFLAFSPERVDPGNPTFQTHNVPKVVGGLTPACVELASALYGSAIHTIVPVSSTRVAEMVKLLENTFRAVNIGLVNELALMCDRMAIDVWEVVDAAKTKPFGFMAFYPGPGLGGHCIPIDPFYLSWKAKQSGFDPGSSTSQVTSMAGCRTTWSTRWPRRSTPTQGDQRVEGADRRGGVQARHRRHARVTGARRHGAAPRPRRASLVRHPHVPEVHGREWSGRFDIKAVNAGRGSFGQYDCIVVITDHTSFDYDAMVAEADLVVDTRNAIKTPARNVFKLGAPRPEARPSPWGQAVNRELCCRQGPRSTAQFTIHGLTPNPAISRQIVSRLPRS